MRIVTLIEDMPGREGCLWEHGLSLYVETESHRLLADTGATGAFAQNAESMGIDLKRIDTVFLSHGHYDHTGGMETFAGINPDAAVFLQEAALGSFWHGEKYIGPASGLSELPGIRLIRGEKRIDRELFVFSGITGARKRPESNQELSVRTDGIPRQDPFLHEQCLVITEGKKHVLLSGCAHNGILNILDRYHAFFEEDPAAVVSGFHMMKKTPYTDGEIRTIREISEELKGTDTLYYTGHCTGETAFGIMKEIMGDRLRAIRTGSEILL